MDHSPLVVELYTPVIPFVTTDAVIHRKQKLDSLLDTPFEHSTLKARDLAGPLATLIIGQAADRYGVLGPLGNFLLHTVRGQPQVAMKFLSTERILTKRSRLVQKARNLIREKFEDKRSTLLGLCKNMNDIYFYTRMQCLQVALASDRGRLPFNSSEICEHFDLLDALDQLYEHTQAQTSSTPVEQEIWLVELYSLLTKVAEVWIQIHLTIFNKYQSYTPQLGCAVVRWYGLADTPQNITTANKLIKEMRSLFRAKKERSNFREISVDGVPRLEVSGKASRQMAAWQLVCREIREADDAESKVD